jgi:hypothetical protein
MTIDAPIWRAGQIDVSATPIFPPPTQHYTSSTSTSRPSRCSRSRAWLPPIAPERDHCAGVFPRRRGRRGSRCFDYPSVNYRVELGQHLCQVAEPDRWFAEPVAAFAEEARYTPPWPTSTTGTTTSRLRPAAHRIPRRRQRGHQGGGSARRRASATMLVFGDADNDGDQDALPRGG